MVEEDQVFVKAFFAIPDKEMELELPLQSPWLLLLEVDLAKKIDHKLTMEFVANRVKENFKSDYFVTCSKASDSSMLQKELGNIAVPSEAVTATRTK